MSDRESGVGEYLEFLRALNEPDWPQFLVGGQAVNFWAEIICGRCNPAGLDGHRPFTSKDCDVWVSHQVWKRVINAPPGKLQKSDSPADGQLGILTLSEAPLRVVDLMSAIYGIPPMQHDQLFRRAPEFEGVRVLDPLYLFLSKCHCLLHLDQSGRQDERHVRMLALILPEYLSLLIAEAEAGAIDERAVLKEIKLHLKIGATGPCRRVMEQLAIGPDSLIPWERMESSNLERFVRYSQNRHGGPPNS